MFVHYVTEANFNCLSESREVKVVRCYVGHLMTSLEMRGIQLSVLRVDGDERNWWLSLLDAPTSAPMWPHPLYHDRITPEKLSDEGYRWDHHFEVIFFSLCQLFYSKNLLFLLYRIVDLH